MIKGQLLKVMGVEGTRVTIGFKIEDTERHGLLETGIITWDLREHGEEYPIKELQRRMNVHIGYQSKIEGIRQLEGVFVLPDESLSEIKDKLIKKDSGG